MRVDVEEVIALQAARKRINTMPIDEIEWYENGVKIDVPPGAVEHFKFTGLSNLNFVEGGFHEGWDGDATPEQEAIYAEMQASGVIDANVAEVQGEISCTMTEKQAKALRDAKSRGWAVAPEGFVTEDASEDQLKEWTAKGLPMRGVFTTSPVYFDYDGVAKEVDAAYAAEHADAPTIVESLYNSHIEKLRGAHLPYAATVAHIAKLRATETELNVVFRFK